MRHWNGVIALCWYSKANGKVRLCLDPAWLNQALIRPVHRGLTLNNILPRLNNVQYMSIINVISGYHNLNLDKQSSYLTTLSCQIGRYQYKYSSFGAVLAGDMFQCKIDIIFNNMPNIFGIADDILVIWYDKNGADHEETVYSVLKQCQDVNLKLNKVSFQMHINTILWWSSVKGRCPTRSMKSQSTDWNASAKKQKGPADLPRYN